MIKRLNNSFLNLVATIAIPFALVYETINPYVTEASANTTYFSSAKECKNYGLVIQDMRDNPKSRFSCKKFDKKGRAVINIVSTHIVITIPETWPEKPQKKCVRFNIPPGTKLGAVNASATATYTPAKTTEVTACPTGLDAKVYLDGRPTGSRKLDSNGVPLAYEIGRVRAERVAEPGML
jgi:hypothetical protein